MTLPRPARLALRTALLTAGAALAVQAAPVVSTFGPLRNRVMPGLSGQGRPDHVALTFDDGPDALSTPFFLRFLAGHGLHATFFVLGREARRTPDLVREMAAAGHEIAVHGDVHRPLLLRGPRATYDDLARARDTVGDLLGAAPRLFRPPYGVMTTAAHLAARRLELTPVLWTCWGEDWTARATPYSVERTVTADLHGGGTILLHDSDRTTAPGAWRSALGALPGILGTCAQRGLRVGPLRDHGLPAAPYGRPRGAAQAPVWDLPDAAGAGHCPPGGLAAVRTRRRP